MSHTIAKKIKLLFINFSVHKIMSIKKHIKKRMGGQENLQMYIYIYINKKVLMLKQNLCSAQRLYTKKNGVGITTVCSCVDIKLYHRYTSPGTPSI